jgi:hypothetical protein
VGRNSILVVIATAKEKIIGASFTAKVTSSEEIAASFTDLIKADGTLEHLAFFFRNGASYAVQCYRHKAIIRHVSLTSRLAGT